MRQMLTQAQTAGQYFTNDQIKEMTRKVSAEVDLVHQQTQNQRSGSSHIGATAMNISNIFFFSSRRRHTRLQGDWSSDVCSSDLVEKHPLVLTSNPPELPPDRVLLLARTIQCGHRIISLPAHLWAIVAVATNYSKIGRASCRERV